MPTVSSAPHAHLRPIYRRLTEDKAFALVSTETQFALLVEAVAEQFEHHAAVMRDYTPAARAALLGHLRKAAEQSPGAREVELWEARKGTRTLSCVATYLATAWTCACWRTGRCGGRSMVTDGPKAEALAAEWKAAATELGWSYGGFGARERQGRARM